MTFELGELFCGPGGIALGAKNAASGEYRVVHKWANDIDEDTCKTYINNICPDDPDSVVCQDVRSLKIEDLPPISALAFGFPCNDFSIIGKQKGVNGQFGPLYSYGVKALQIFKPQWFLAENVSGLHSANEGRALKRILSDLQNEGYILTPHLYRFEDYGIPQARHRIIIVGIRADLGLKFKVPDPYPYSQMDNSCRHALEVPPIPMDAPNHEKPRMSKHVEERLKYIQPGENAFTADLPEHLQLKIKGATISQIYKRLDPDKPAYTVTGSGGGGTHMYHWEEPRALTNRERARLQTFPDNFIFSGSREKVRRQIGMAVPYEGARIIIEAIMKTFSGEKYPSIPENITTANAVSYQESLF